MRPAQRVIFAIAKPSCCGTPLLSFPLSKLVRGTTTYFLTPQKADYFCSAEPQVFAMAGIRNQTSRITILWGCGVGGWVRVVLTSSYSLPSPLFCMRLCVLNSFRHISFVVYSRQGTRYGYAYEESTGKRGPDVSM